MMNILKWAFNAFILLALIPSSYAGISYVHTDNLGSVVAESNSYGTVTGRYYYEPFGLVKPPRYSSPPTFTGYDQPAYAGHTLDEDTGLTYMKARFYDPAIGRFYSPDPAEFYAGIPSSLNKYIYASNSPYKYLDPNGEWVESAIDFLSLSIGIDSLADSLSMGNYGAAAVDGVGIFVDSVALAMPLVPGGAGIGISSLRSTEGLIYRGVSAGHPDINLALSGKVQPGNIYGSVSPEAHNLGGIAQDSPFTSWTWDIEIALSHATKDGPGGALLVVPQGAPPQGASWSWELSPDNWGESEVLLRGPRDSIDVFTDFDGFGGF